MRVLPEALQARLDSGATTLCRCWRIDRLDGVSLGFTDHDAVLHFEDIDFEPRSGEMGSALEASAGLDIDTVEISGALTSTSIADADIDRGLFDDARLRRWLVDWSALSLRVLDFDGTLGEIRRRGEAFEAEVRGVSDMLSRVQGRQLLPTCDAVLGDQRCGVDLADAAFRATVSIVASDAGRLRVAGAAEFDAGWFDNGRFVVNGGQPSGPTTTFDGRILSFRRDGASETLGDVIDLEDTPIDPLAVGLEATLVAGCDKRLETCAAKFQNRLNFRGFPHVPGDDWSLAYPKSGDTLDGGSRFRARA